MSPKTAKKPKPGSFDDPTTTNDLPFPMQAPLRRSTRDRHPPSTPPQDRNKPMSTPATPKKRKRNAKPAKATIDMPPTSENSRLLSEVSNSKRQRRDQDSTQAMLEPAMELTYPDDDTDSAVISGEYLQAERIMAIIKSAKNPVTIFEALSDLSKLLSSIVPSPMRDRPLLLQDLDSDDKTIENIKLTYLRQLFRTHDSPQELFENGGANLFFTSEEWENDVVRNRFQNLISRVDDPAFAPHNTPEQATTVNVLPPTPVTPTPLRRPPRPSEITPESASPSISGQTMAARLANHGIVSPQIRPRTNDQINDRYSDPITLPDICEVTDPALQDAFLVSEGIDYSSFPNLRAGALVSWNALAERKGNIAFSEWVKLGVHTNVEFFISFFQFCRSGNYVNLARINPRDLTVFDPRHNSGIRRIIYTRDTHEQVIALFPVQVEACMLDSYAVTSGQKRYHKLDGILHAQEADRSIGAIVMLLGEGNSEMSADVLGDVVTFSTRWEPNVSHASTASANRVYSAATGGASTSATPTSNVYSLPFNADVPIYDARCVNGIAPDFDVNQDLAAIETILPRFAGDIPPDSLAVVAATIASTSQTNKRPPLKVNFNIRFVILLGTSIGESNAA
ncbi:hypothetical protein K435DRAFT_845524 [Dendrothele bispora CBS 962.96]|uniref:Uncharacterized protein n=1 Tax=Dendrothele bispora (strain CBS 962.96) TaxID=1314807 RepID=A0A4S8KTT2_DENBC|nr:hypothetical protein K435DRAFT_845524 [Dendrothele bispora CBS 962.96]